MVEPDTILRWHRVGFRAYWRWRSGGRPGRPKIDRGLPDLIRQMSKDNPLWGAPRIHGELLKLGFEVAEFDGLQIPGQTPRTAVAKLANLSANHADAIVAIDLCVVRSPWQNPHVERLIGTLRRDCLDHVLIFGEQRLRQILTLYSRYYNEARTHLGLRKDTPRPKPVQRTGTIVATPILSGLHHRYARI